MMLKGGESGRFASQGLLADGIVACQHALLRGHLEVAKKCQRKSCQKQGSVVYLQSFSDMFVLPSL